MYTVWYKMEVFESHQLDTINILTKNVTHLQFIYYAISKAHPLSFERQKWLLKYNTQLLQR